MDFYRNGFMIVVVALIAMAIYWMLTPFWGALAWGICLAFLLTPVHRWLSFKLKGRNSLSAAIITLLVPVALAGLLVSLGASFANQIAVLITLLKNQSLHFNAHLLSQLESYPLIGGLAEWLRQNLTATTEQIQESLISGANELLHSLASSGGMFVLGALGSLIHFFMMLFLLFFLLRDGHQLLNSTMRLVPMEAKRKSELLTLVSNTTYAVVLGAGLTALAQGALVGIGFAIAGLPSALVFGVLAAALAILPIGGAALVWAPAVVYLIASAQWKWAIFMLIWGVFVSISDNALRPLLISRYSPVSVLTVFIGVIGGISAFGLIGTVVGPVLLNLVAALLGSLDETLPPNRSRF